MSSASFDHLVGALLELQRHFEAERLGGLEINDELELGWRLDWEFARLRAIQDAIGVDRSAAIVVDPVVAIGDKAADLRELTEWVDGRNGVAGRQRRDLCAMIQDERVRHEH